jgi:hypothetical protein
MGSDMSIGNLPVGSATPIGAGASSQIKGSQGALLGFLASVAGTANIYDNAASTATNPIVTALPIAVGWNPIPVAFATGCYIVLTTAAGSVVWV